MLQKQNKRPIDPARSSAIKTPISKSILSQRETKMNNLGHREQQAYEFLRKLYPEDTSGFLSIFTMPDPQANFYPMNNAGLEQAAKKAVLMSDKGKQVYFGVGLLGELPTKGRGKSEDVSALPGLHLDIDCLGGAHAEKALPTFEQAKVLIKKFPLPPSINVLTGGGYHLYWLFDKPWVFANKEEKQRALELLKKFQCSFILIAISKGWKIDNTSDLARLLRVPGTFNLKKELALVETHVNEHHYTVAELEAAIKEMESVYPTVPTKKHSKKDQSLLNDEFPLADADAMRVPTTLQRRRDGSVGATLARSFIHFSTYGKRTGNCSRNIRPLSYVQSRGNGT